MRPWVRKRWRHLPTVWRLVRTLSATALLFTAPSAHRSTISARRTSPAGRLRERTSDSSSSRAPSLTSSAFNGRPRGIGLSLVRVDEGYDTLSSSLYQVIYGT